MQLVVKKKQDTVYPKQRKRRILTNIYYREQSRNFVCGLFAL